MTEEERIQELSDLLVQMELDGPGLIDRIAAFGQMKEAGYDSIELDTIWMRYIKHAGPAILITVYDLYMKSIQRGFSDRAAKAAIRLGLATEFGEQEYFTSEDVAECIGVSVEEVNQTIAEHERELFQNGGLVKVTPAPWLPQGQGKEYML